MTTMRLTLLSLMATACCALESHSHQVLRSGESVFHGDPDRCDLVAQALGGTVSPLPSDYEIPNWNNYPWKYENDIGAYYDWIEQHPQTNEDPTPANEIDVFVTDLEEPVEEPVEDTVIDEFPEHEEYISEQNEDDEFTATIVAPGPLGPTLNNPPDDTLRLTLAMLSGQAERDYFGDGPALVNERYIDWDEAWRWNLEYLRQQFRRSDENLGLLYGCGLTYSTHTYDGGTTSVDLSNFGIHSRLGAIWAFNDTLHLECSGYAALGMTAWSVENGAAHYNRGSSFFVANGLEAGLYFRRGMAEFGAALGYSASLSDYREPGNNQSEEWRSSGMTVGLSAGLRF